MTFDRAGRRALLALGGIATAATLAACDAAAGGGSTTSGSDDDQPTTTSGSGDADRVDNAAGSSFR